MEYDPSLEYSTSMENSVEKLMKHVREAAQIAEATWMDGDFNAMTWLDLALEDTPEIFDDFFERPWHELAEDEKRWRVNDIRSVL